MSKLSEIKNSWYPTGHDYILDYFEDYDYRKCREPWRLDYSRADNWVGYQQRAFVIWWALERCAKMGEVGLDIGSAGVFTPYCLSTDKYMTYNHPDYGGQCVPQLLLSGEDLSIIGDNTIPLLVGNHVFEHLDGDPVEILKQWATKLKHHGVIAQIVPDATYCDIFTMDKSHKHSWTAPQFKEQVLDKVVDVLDIMEFATLDNKFSFNFVVRKK